MDTTRKRSTTTKSKSSIGRNEEKSSNESGEDTSGGDSPVEQLKWPHPREAVYEVTNRSVDPIAVRSTSDKRFCVALDDRKYYVSCDENALGLSPTGTSNRERAYYAWQKSKANWPPPCQSSNCKCPVNWGALQWPYCCTGCKNHATRPPRNGHRTGPVHDLECAGVKLGLVHPSRCSTSQ